MFISQIIWESDDFLKILIPAWNWNRKHSFADFTSHDQLVEERQLNLPTKNWWNYKACRHPPTSICPLLIAFSHLSNLIHALSIFRQMCDRQNYQLEIRQLPYLCLCTRISLGEHSFFSKQMDCKVTGSNLFTCWVSFCFIRIFFLKKRNWILL